ncbi:MULTISPECIES: hypothetical protein [Prauserella salsuginis group]|uniref:Uncharacterized protein n=1 Tax=Prauserella salsuginis TaxID=387889 RepID=A0ABW6G317_9PSEU|nr:MULTISPECIES: hypothetical protein [Prauserella salsuginis group]MCR3718460.1 hypothetical protein [Prauserella flava]MCR3733030.1 hypothetical protein [Prauserella salsuginis]
MTADTSSPHTAAADPGATPSGAASSGAASGTSSSGASAPDATPSGATPSGADAARAEAVRAQTRADREEFLTAGLVPVACHACATTVLVKKNSPEHTSIQWISDAATSCPVLAERVASGVPAARAGTCERLRESITTAERDGAFGYER